MDPLMTFGLGFGVVLGIALAIADHLLASRELRRRAAKYRRYARPIVHTEACGRRCMKDGTHAS